MKKEERLNRLFGEIDDELVAGAAARPIPLKVWLPRVTAAVAAVAMVAVAELLAVPLSRIFVGYDAQLLELTVRGFRIYALSFLFSGFAIFASGFFTALNDGVTSAIISFLRTMVFQSAAVLVLPLIWEIDGIWYSLIAAEGMAVVLGGGFMVAKRKKYHY